MARQACARPSIGAAIVLAPDGMTYTFKQTAIRYPVEDMAGSMVGTTETHIIYGKDGARITIDPNEWAHGNEMIRLLDRIVPPELVFRARQGAPVAPGTATSAPLPGTSDGLPFTRTPRRDSLTPHLGFLPRQQYPHAQGCRQPW